MFYENVFGRRKLVQNYSPEVARCVWCDSEAANSDGGGVNKGSIKGKIIPLNLIYKIEFVQYGVLSPLCSTLVSYSISNQSKP